jgi:hypothetical protein
MEGSKDGQTLDDGFDVGIHDDSLVVFGATVNDAMSDGVDSRGLVFLETIQQVLDPLL